MKRKLLYFILLAFTFVLCDEPKIVPPKSCFDMIFSRSLPVKMWLNNELSFNNSKFSGITKKCFYQKWNCEDKLKWQFEDTVEENTYSLKALNRYRNELASIAFTKEAVTAEQPIEADLQFSRTSFASGISGWSNFNGSDRALDPSFAHIITAAICQSSSKYRSKYFATQRPDNPGLGWPPGDYEIEVEADDNSEGSGTVVKIYGMPDNANQTLIAQNAAWNFPTGDGPTLRTITFTLDQYWPYLALGFEVIEGGGFDISVALMNAEITEAPANDIVFDHNVFTVEFIPSDNEVCNQLVMFEIIEDHDEESESRLAYSDYQDIKAFHKDTILLLYTNNIWWDGLDYPTTEIVFGIRLSAKFYEPESPEDAEYEDDSDGKTYQIFASIKDQTILELEPVPPYLYRTCKRVVKHNTLYIGNTRYVAEEALAKEKLDDKFGLYPLKVTLTEYES